MLKRICVVLTVTSEEDLPINCVNFKRELFVENKTSSHAIRFILRNKLKALHPAIDFLYNVLDNSTL